MKVVISSVWGREGAAVKQESLSMGLIYFRETRLGKLLRSAHIFSLKLN